MPTPRVALVVISDRGDRYLPQCLERLEAVCDWDFAERILIEDPHHQYGQNEVVTLAWSRVGPDIDYIAHLEEDFLVHEFNVGDMIRILEANPELAQVVLKRQPWNSDEVRCGGIVEQDPPEYEDRDGFARHNRIFSLNPCVIPKRIADLGWTDGEGEFSDRLRAMGYWFAFYGQKLEPPRCTHIGDERWSPP